MTHLSINSHTADTVLLCETAEKRSFGSSFLSAAMMSDEVVLLSTGSDCYAGQRFMKMLWKMEKFYDLRRTGNASCRTDRPGA